MERITPERYIPNTVSVSTASEIAFPHRATTNIVAQPSNSEHTIGNITPAAQAGRRGRKPKHKPLKSPPKVTEVVVAPGTQTVTLEFQPDGTAIQEINKIQLDKASEVVHQLMEISQTSGDGHITTFTLTKEQAQEFLGQLNRYTGTDGVPSNVNTSFMQPNGTVSMDKSRKLGGSTGSHEVLCATSTQIVNTTGSVASEPVTTETTATDATTATQCSTHISKTVPIPATATSDGMQPSLKGSNSKPNKSQEGPNNTSQGSYLSPDIMQLLTQTNVPTTTDSGIKML